MDCEDLGKPQLGDCLKTERLAIVSNGVLSSKDNCRTTQNVMEREGGKKGKVAWGRTSHVDFLLFST